MVIRLSVMADQDDSSLLNKSSPIALTCEDFYTKRVRYLERFRERHESLTTPTSTPTSSYRLSKSANSINEYLSNNSLSSDISSSTSERNHGSNFVQLGNDMLYLLEKDVQLTKQLVDLNNAIEQLKTCFASPSAATKNASASSRKLTKVLSNSSLSSVNSLNADGERTKEPENISKEINHVSVNDDDDDDIDGVVDDYDDEDELFYPDNHGQPKQYFQRQNSALRIPVRSRSKRFATEDFTASSGKRNGRTKTNTRSLNEQRNSLPMYEQNRSNLHSPNSDSGHSAASCSSRTPAGNVVTVGSTVLICHGSQSSFDSGVHSASPEEREEIFV